jgi:nitrogen regulatory protein P-II 1
MKKIEAIIKPFKLEEVKDILSAMRIHGATVTEVRVHSRQKGKAEVYRGAKFGEEFIPKIKLELVVTDEQKSGAVDAILHAAKTGKVGDGRVFVLEISDAIRIRTGERGADAV